MVLPSQWGHACRFLQCRGEVSRRSPDALVRDVRRRASCNHGPAGVARAGSKIDHVIGHRDNAHVQLRGDDRVARIDQRLQMRDQTIRVGAVEPGRRLVQYVQRVSTLRTLQLGRELDTLRLTPKELAHGNRAGDARNA